MIWASLFIIYFSLTRFYANPAHKRALVRANLDTPSFISRYNGVLIFTSAVLKAIPASSTHDQLVAVIPLPGDARLSLRNN